MNSHLYLQTLEMPLGTSKTRKMLRLKSKSDMGIAPRRCDLEDEEDRSTHWSSNQSSVFLTQQQEVPTRNEANRSEITRITCAKNLNSNSFRSTSLVSRLPEKKKSQPTVIDVDCL